ncbi:MAG: Holliday junction resolvase RuvX [Planctomycetota bacterium]|jgi:putative Holliday junction resolvase
MKRILGIDWGARRAGFALSDPTGFLASPLGLKEVRSRDELVQIAVEEAGRHDVSAFVVGIPYNMNGTLGEMGVQATEFADLLEARSGLPVHRWDERLTTVQAERALRQGGLSRKKRKAKRDMMAARIILQSFLDAQRATSGEEGE